LRIVQQHPDKIPSFRVLFDFWQPEANRKPSEELDMTRDQHDVMYAIAGCSDVNGRIKNLSQEVLNS
jgi:hypothetical protein